MSRNSCIYFELLEVLILVSLKDLETKLCKHNQKEVVSVHYIKGGVKKRFCQCRNLRCEFISSIAFKANDSLERLPSKIHLRYFTFACCFISIPLYKIFKDLEFQSLCLVPNNIESVYLIYCQQTSNIS